MENENEKINCEIKDDNYKFFIFILCRVIFGYDLVFFLFWGNVFFFFLFFWGFSSV